MSTTATAMSFPAPYGYADYVASIDVSVLTSDQYGVIRTFLMRVLDLTAEARGALAVNLANSTAVALHHTPPSNVPPELFLVCVASAYQARHGGVVPPPTGWGAQPAPPPADGGRPLRRVRTRSPAYGQPQPGVRPAARPTPPRPAAGLRAASDLAALPGSARRPAGDPTSAPAVGPAAGALRATAVRHASRRRSACGPCPGSPPRFDQPPVDPRPTATVPVEPTRRSAPSRRPGRPASQVVRRPRFLAPPRPCRRTRSRQPRRPPRRSTPGRLPPHPPRRARRSVPSRLRGRRGSPDRTRRPWPPVARKRTAPTATPRHPIGRADQHFGRARRGSPTDAPVPFRGARLPRPLGLDADAPRGARGHAAVAHRPPRQPVGRAPPGP